ncbi:MAG: tyrosine-type recombinase/integrase [Proteobacteria bacterium]|nr:tyrosine-type recombinase/integrase [Pseudomonadota bacterium]
MATIEKRETENGKATYRVKVRMKGHPVQTATFNRLSDARKWVQDTESAIREGRHFKTAEAKRHTLGEMIDRYQTEMLARHPKAAEDRKGHLAWWKGQLGAFTLADITPALLAEYRDKLMDEGRANATAAKYLAVLSHAFTLAVNEWNWLEISPMNKVKKPALPRGRVRYLSDAERESLLAACKESSSPYLYTAVVLALATGMRQGELMGLSWDDIDLPRGRAILHETKNGERRAVHLAGHALEQIKELGKVRRLDTKLLFPGHRHKGKPLDLRAPWEQALKAAGIEDFHFHDLRHSCASYLAMNGASLSEIAEVLGHKTLAMVKRYSHLSDAHVSGVVERMNNKIFG